jgi:hypothetical protein
MDCICPDAFGKKLLAKLEFKGLRNEVEGKKESGS